MTDWSVSYPFFMSMNDLWSLEIAPEEESNWSFKIGCYQVGHSLVHLFAGSLFLK